MPPLSPDIPLAQAPPPLPAPTSGYGFVEPGSDLRGRTSEAHTPRTDGVSVDIARAMADTPAPEDTLMRIVTDADIVAARRQGRDLALRVGLSSPDATLIATAISELARNIVLYAVDGEIVLRPLQQGSRPGVLVIARDRGPGMPQAAAATGCLAQPSPTSGLGLRGLKLLMDEFAIDSQPDRGTTVLVKKWSR